MSGPPPTDGGLGPGEAWYARLVGLALLAAVVSPALADPPRDDYPLSTYPMFTAHRATAWLHVARAAAEDGTEEALPPVLVGGSPELMQAAQTMRQALARGRVPALCQEIAERVAADDELEHVRAVRIVSVKYEPIAWFTQPDPRPLTEQERTRCAVRRPPSDATP